MLKTDLRYIGFLLVFNFENYPRNKNKMKFMKMQNKN